MLVRDDVQAPDGRRGQPEISNQVSCEVSRARRRSFLSWFARTYPRLDEEAPSSFLAQQVKLAEKRRACSAAVHPPRRQIADLSWLGFADGPERIVAALGFDILTDLEICEVRVGATAGSTNRAQPN